jgi:hypothetical protein
MQKLALIEVVMDELGAILADASGLSADTRRRLIRAQANAARVDIAQREIVNLMRHGAVVAHTRRLARQYAEDMPMNEAASSSSTESWE